MMDMGKMLWLTTLFALAMHGGTSSLVDAAAGRMEGDKGGSWASMVNLEDLREEAMAKIHKQRERRNEEVLMSLEHADRWLTEELENEGTTPNITENLNDNLFFQTMYSMFENETNKGYLLGEGADFFVDPQEREENKDIPPAYPILDALVASIPASTPSRSSLEDLLLAIQCFLEKQTRFEGLSWDAFLEKYVYKPLQEIVANILDRVAETFDKGYNYNARVVETVDEEIFVSENYIARIRGATIATYVMDSSTFEQLEDEAIGKVALAAEVLLNPNDQFGSFYNAESQNLGQDYNITVVLETNVMTMQNMGAMHWPGHRTKGPNRPPGPRYCFDDFHEGADFKGVLRKGHPNVPTILGFEFYRRSLILPIAGSTYEISSVRTLPSMNLLKSRFDRDYASFLTFKNASNKDAPISSSDLRPLDEAIKHQWILESSRTPRPGLIAIRELYQREYKGLVDNDPIRNCFEEQSQLFFFANYDLCYEVMYNITEQAGILSDLALSETITDPSLLRVSLPELNFMDDDITDWYNYWIEVDPLVLQVSEVPYTFSKAIALPTKIRGPLFEIAYMANPYFTREEVFERFATPINLFVPALAVCPPDAGDEGLIYTFFAAALKMRLLDVPSSSEWASMIEAEPALLERSRPLSEWAIYAHPNETFWSSVFDEENLAFLDQSVSFEMENEEINEDGISSYQMIAPGNLTKNEAGRNHEYFIVTPFPSDESIQAVFQEQQENLDVWARTAAKAIEADNPCRNALDDNDLYLYVIGIIAATCGGMQTVLLSIHQSLHFFTGRFWSRGRTRSNFFLRRLVPTYELIISTLGVFILLILYYPILLQLRSEQEVADFQTEATGMDVQYSDDFTVKFAHLGQFALVTVVHVTSQCQDSRVTLLRGVLICGIFFGLLMNAIFLWSAFGALKRYSRIVVGRDGNEERALKNITPADSSLRLLELPFGSMVANSTAEGEANDQGSESLPADEMAPLTESVASEKETNQAQENVLEEGMSGGQKSSKTLATQTSGNDSENPIVET